MSLAQRPFRTDIAVHFDQDGVIFDTERVKQMLWLEAAREMGLGVLPPTAFRFTLGMRRAEILKEIETRFSLSADGAVALMERRNALYEEFKRSEGGVPVKPGAPQLLAVLQDLRVPVGLVTQSHASETRQNLESARFERAFQVVVTGDQVEQGKPHPEGYLRAANAVGVAPERSYGIEDSHPGGQAVLNAGFKLGVIRDLSPLSEGVLKMAMFITRKLGRVQQYFQISIGQRRDTTAPEA